VVVSIDPAEIHVHHALKLTLLYPKGSGYSVISGWPHGKTRQTRVDVVTVPPLATALVRDAVRVARSSNRRLFSIFPVAPGERMCLPRLLATCQTSVQARGRSAIVTFSEAWPVCGPYEYCPLITPTTPQPEHAWRIVERERGGKLHVVAIRSRGDAPPQSR
jgi:hypothetical protein